VRRDPLREEVEADAGGAGTGLSSGETAGEEPAELPT